MLKDHKEYMQTTGENIFNTIQGPPLPQMVRSKSNSQRLTIDEPTSRRAKSKSFNQGLHDFEKRLKH